jgi:hypothetical protein
MTTTAEPSALRSALTFFASFDKGPDADFALGDPQVYHAVFPLYADPAVEPELTRGLGSPPLAIAPGKFGSALAFTKERSHIVCYRAERNVAYSAESFRGSASFWLNVDPLAIPQQYSDPFQITDKDYNNDCIWIDFTKNDTPPDFRLGIFGDQSVWDPKDQHQFAEEFFFRLLRVTEPPFAGGAWTHVVINWDGLNTSRSGRGVLFLNGVRQGKTGAVSERFNLNISKATIRLGTGPFVGLLDDLAMFNRPLSDAEVAAVYAMEDGISELFVGCDPK